MNILAGANTQCDPFIITHTGKIGICTYISYISFQ